jgi:hypothetical protein
VAQGKRGWFGSLFPRGAAAPGHEAITSIASKIGPISFPYRRRSLLSPAELAFYNVLKDAVGDRFEILLKVGVRDLCEITHRDVNRAAFNRVAAKQVDFVLCDGITLSPVVAIELDASSHYPRERAERDSFMNELFRGIGVALIRHRVQMTYDTAAIERWVDSALASLARAKSSSTTEVRPAS